MPDENRFAVYFSHSWRPRDVDLNVRVWEELAVDCELLVDEPEEPGANPPYYINRIEELLQRADLFVSVLTYRDPRPGDFTGDDANLRCSPYSLFEIRLAERAGLPHLVLYERTTGFRPPHSIRPGEAYVPFDRGPRELLPEQRQWTNVIHAKIEQWKVWARDHRRPLSYEQSTMAALLLSGAPQDPVCAVLENALRDSGYDSIRCDPARQRSSEALRLLREAGLVVVEFAGQDAFFQQLYAAAHGLGLPSIRLLHSPNGQPGLPWILRGDPGGYQEDIVVWGKPEELPKLVKPRMQAMFRLSPAKRDGEASDYLQSRRYAQFYVFLSHTLKDTGRKLVEEIYSLLRQHHVPTFEYHETNPSGANWKQELKDALQKTTHFVALEDPVYVTSPTCTEELEAVLARGNEVSILPFMIAGQQKPHPKLTNIHNRLVSGESPRADAEAIVQGVMAALDAAPVIALAGRRIDAPGAPAPRFPLDNLETVRQRLRSLVESRRASALVSSAACGADLLAQSEAGKLGLRRRVILPFDRERFLKSSVIDRPGDWAPLYNQLLDSAATAGDLVVLGGAGEDVRGYAALSRTILDEAQALGRSLHEPVIALLAWDGSSGDDNDLTAAFGAEAKQRDIPVIEVSTL